MGTTFVRMYTKRWTRTGVLCAEYTKKIRFFVNCTMVSQERIRRPFPEIKKEVIT